MARRFLTSQLGSSNSGILRMVMEEIQGGVSRRA